MGGNGLVGGHLGHLGVFFISKIFLDYKVFFFCCCFIKVAMAEQASFCLKNIASLQSSFLFYKGSYG